MPNEFVARYLMTTQRGLEQIDARRAGKPRKRERLIAPLREPQRPPTPAWSPRAQAERRPMRVMRFARDLW